jgi:2,4-dienoyl-CoA reductase (NADPH2)
MANLLAFLVPQTLKAGATIKTGVTATAETVLAERPDAVIVATGATPYAPELAGDGSVPVMTADGPVALNGRPGRRVVIMDEDGYYWTTAVAESVMAEGREPVMVTRFFEVAREVPIVSRIAFLRELDRNGGKLRPNHYVARAANGGVTLRHYLTEREEHIEDVAAVAWVGPSTPNSALAETLETAGFERGNIHVVGDAFQPRRLANALSEAHAAARTIGSRAR